MKKILFIILISFLITPIAFASRILEDFTTYTEVDVPADRINITSSKITITSADRDENCYVYKDKGSNFFSGDFEHWMTVSTTANEYFQGNYWGLSNELGSLNTWTNGIYLSIHNTGPAIYLTELDNNSVYNDGYTFVGDTPLYIEVIRDEEIGTYGTIYAYIYSDSDHTILLDTLSVTLHTSKKDFQYIYGITCSNDGVTGRDWDGYIENLSLAESASPTPTPSSIPNTDNGTYSNPHILTFTILGLFSALAVASLLLKFTKSI